MRTGHCGSFALWAALQEAHLKGGVNTSTPGTAGRDGAEVVACGVLLGAHSTGWFVCFA
jgi:hypothetical protein